MTAADLGDAAQAKIKNLDNLAVAFVNNICKQQGRSSGCTEWVDLYGKRDKNNPLRKVKVLSYSDLTYTVNQKI